jgi:hypothetical protein
VAGTIAVQNYYNSVIGFIMVLEQLFHSLSQRKRPEDVAELIRTLLGEKLSAPEKKALDKAAKGALRRNLWGYTSMSQVFAKPVGALKQITKTAELFQVAPLPDQLAGEVTEIAGFIADTSGLIGKTYAQSNFLKDRLNKQQRKEFGLDLSKRQYNKRFRMLKRLEKKLYTFKREGRKAEFAQIAKHGLAHQITWEEFSRDENTACFIAYYTARCNLRSEFTISGQQRPYDEIAHMLFRRCAGTLKTGLWDGLLTQKTESPTAHWWAIAQVYPHTQVLAHLTDEQKGLLLGRWTSILQELSLMLEEIWRTSQINRETMVVRRGNDSSTWNSMAGAWNKARDSWINLLYGMGLEAILEQVCFGKVLRLMAADVAAWHVHVGE